MWQFYLPGFSFMTPMPGPPYGYRQVFIESYFGTFGSLEVNFRKSIYGFLQIGAALGLVALYTTAVVRVRTLLRRWPEAVVLAGAVVSMLTVLHYAAYRALQTSPDPVITGRYLLPCVAVYAVAIAWVARSLPARAGVILGGVALSVSSLLSLGGLALSLARFYA